MSATIQHGSQEVAQNVVYEITMLRYTYDRLEVMEVDVGHIQPGDVMPRVGTGIDTQEGRAASALVESFLLHARVLRDFFCRSPRPKPDDVIAADFVSGWVPPADSSYPYLASQKTRLDKALAHLSIARMQYVGDNKTWDLPAIRGELDGIIEQFLQALPATTSAWFVSVR